MPLVTCPKCDSSRSRPVEEFEDWAVCTNCGYKYNLTMRIKKIWESVDNSKRVVTNNDTTGQAQG